MNTSRREAIKVGLAAGAALIATGGRLRSVCANATAAWPTRDALAACVGEQFVVAQSVSAPVALELVRVADLAAACEMGLCSDPEAFTVIFRSSASTALAQDTYRMRNRTLGEFDLFIVPSKAEDGRIYIATVNRIAAAQTRVTRSLT